MTYSVGGLIQANDYNSGVSSVNTIWSNNGGTFGYGQGALGGVSVSSVVSAGQWNAYFSAIRSMASHQGTSITALPAPSAGTTISYLSQLQPAFNAVNTYRMNAAFQGGSAQNSNTSPDEWDVSLTANFGIQFASHDAARYFFNSGGQLAISASHPGGNQASNEIRDLAAAIGTIYFSSLSGITIAGTGFNGVTKIGGSGSPSTIASGSGFYNTGTSLGLIFRQYYNGTDYYQLSAAYNGAGYISFQAYYYVETPYSIGQKVAAGTVNTVTVRYPETTYLGNSWGTPSLSNNSSSYSYCPKPYISSNISSTSAMVGTPFSASIQLGNTTSIPTAYAIGPGSAGIGVSVSGSTINVYGTPTATGDFAIAIGATDACGYGQPSSSELVSNSVTVIAGRPPSIRVLLVGGGGGGGDTSNGRSAGGGGGGVYVIPSFPIYSGSQITLTVGAGGASADSGSPNAIVGGTSYIEYYGQPGTRYSATGGGSGANSGDYARGAYGGTSGYPQSTPGGPDGGGGGGGDGIIPPSGGVYQYVSPGGNGRYINGGEIAPGIDGNYYGGGGGGGATASNPGGAGGGGAGGGYRVNGQNGTNGYGGGGGASSGYALGGQGGSGFVVVAYPDIYPYPTSVSGVSGYYVSGGFRVFTFSDTATSGYMYWAN